MAESTALVSFYDDLLAAIDADSNDLDNLLIQNFHSIEDGFGDVLHEEVQCSNASNVQHLLELGCDVDTLNKDLKTPLLVALENNDVNMINVLIEAKANIYHIGAEGKTVVQMAFESESVDSDIIYSFLDCIQVDFPDKDVLLKTLLNIKCPMFYATHFRDIQLMEGLLKSGLDIESPTPSHKNWTALHKAVEMCNVPLVTWLLSNGANVNALDAGGCSPLHIAAMFRSIDILRLLLEHGADPNITESDDNTPFNYVLKNLLDYEDEDVHCQCIELLFEYNAIPHNSNVDPKTLFDYAGEVYENCTQFLIAIVALIDARTTRNGSASPLADSVLFYNTDIEDADFLDSNYRYYRQILRKIVYRKLTVLDLLSTSEKKIRAYVHDPTFIASVTRIGRQKLDKSLFYYKRFIKIKNEAIVAVKLEEAAVVTLSKLFGSNYNESYIFAKKVASYLSLQDLTHLKEAFN